MHKIYTLDEIKNYYQTIKDKYWSDIKNWRVRKIKKNGTGVVHLTSLYKISKYSVYERIIKYGYSFSAIFLIPTLVTITIATLTMGSEPPWLKGIENATIINSIFLILLAMFIIIEILLIINFRNRKIKKKTNKLRFHSHKVNHCARDSVCGLIKRSNLNNINISSEAIHLLNISEGLCNAIEKYFIELVDDESIGCAIRLGINTIKNENSEYVTIARSSNLDSSRSNTSEPLKRNEGIIKYLEKSHKGRKGVLFFYDIEESIIKEAYVATNNDAYYKGAIESMIVTPLNGLNGNYYDCIGLLHITSETNKIMDARLVDIIKTYADLLSTTYTSLFSVLDSKTKDEIITLTNTDSPVQDVNQGNIMDRQEYLEFERIVENLMHLRTEENTNQISKKINDIISSLSTSP